MRVDESWLSWEFSSTRMRSHQLGPNENESSSNSHQLSWKFEHVQSRWEQDYSQSGRRLGRIIHREYKRFFCPIRRQYSESFLNCSGKTFFPRGTFQSLQLLYADFLPAVSRYFLPAFSRFPRPTNYPWVSEDDAKREWEFELSSILILVWPGLK